MEEFSTQGLFLPGGDLDLGGKQWLDAQAGDLQSPGSYTTIPTRSQARCEVPREGWRDSRLLHKKSRKGHSYHHAREWGLLWHERGVRSSVSQNCALQVLSTCRALPGQVCLD